MQVFRDGHSPGACRVYLSIHTAFLATMFSSCVWFYNLSELSIPDRGEFPECSMFPWLFSCVKNRNFDISEVKPSAVIKAYI